MNPRLSILICSVAERCDNFAINIQRQIYDQVNRLADPQSVEVIVLTDNRHMTIGAKRNHLVAMASGQYTVFVDDDDQVASDYVSSLLEATESGADVLTFNLEYRLNGKKVRVLRHSLKYRDDNRRCLNTPRHTSAVSREIALKLPFPDSSYGEDFDWATRLLAVAKTEHNTDRTLYYYNDVPATSVARQYADPTSPAHRSWLEAQDRYSLGPRISDNDYLATLRHVLDLHPKGTALEFGVGSGRTLQMIADCMPVIGFDSFDGLPEKWRDGFDTGMFACEPPDVPNAKLVQGLFADTLPRFEFPEHVGLVHMDCDLYGSAKTVLEHVGPHLRPGTYVCFDEAHGYPGWENHEWKAWQEFAARTGISWTVISHGPEQRAVRISGKGA